MITVTVIMIHHLDKLIIMQMHIMTITIKIYAAIMTNIMVLTMIMTIIVILEKYMMKKLNQMRQTLNKMMIIGMKMNFGVILSKLEVIVLIIMIVTKNQIKKNVLNIFQKKRMKRENNMQGKFA